MKRTLAALAVLAGLAFPGGAQAIVGGTEVSSITKFPFQVELWNQLGGNAVDGFFCGGVILDSTHVATAAHCVFDESTGEATPLGQLHVLAGTNDISAAGTDVGAVAASFDPRYDPTTNDYDWGVITVSSPLFTGSPVPNGTTTTIAPVPLIAPDDPTGLTATGKVSTVSGWGDTNPEPVNGLPTPSYPTKLRSVPVKFSNITTCANNYATISLAITARMVCAADTGKDSCYGDSGGPLVVLPSGGTAPTNYQLGGLVESGAGCANSFYPGIYDRVSNVDVRTFLQSSPPDAPRQQSPTTIGGTPAAGQAITCQPGAWSGSPGFEYEFFRDAGGEGAFLVAGPSTQPTYTVQPGDVGTQLFCIVKASNAGGYGFGTSPLVTGATAVPITTPPATVVDTAKPTLAIARKSCSRRGRCVVNALVADATPSSGIARVTAKLRWRTVVACKSAKKRCTRMKTKTLSAKAIGGGHYLVTATRLKAGTYTLILTAYDKAGNKQQKPTHTTLRVKR